MQITVEKCIGKNSDKNIADTFSRKYWISAIHFANIINEPGCRHLHVRLGILENILCFLCEHLHGDIAAVIASKNGKV